MGIGLRVAGRVAGERLNGDPAKPQTSAAQQQASTAQQQAQPRSNYAVNSGSIRKGVGGFFKPFRRVGGIVFLEVMGLMFLLFVLIFVQSAWRYHADYATGPNHDRFLVSVVLGVVFLYLSLSSFWRARKR